MAQGFYRSLATGAACYMRRVMSSGKVDRERVIRKLCERGAPDQAMRELRQFADSGLLPSQKLLSSIVYFCQVNRDARTLEEVAGFIAQAGIDVDQRLGSSLIVGMASFGQFGRARPVYWDMQRQGASVRDGAVNALLEGAVREGDSEFLSELLWQLQSRQSEPPPQVGEAVLSLARKNGCRSLVDGLMGAYREAGVRVEPAVANQFSSWAREQEDQYAVTTSAIGTRGQCCECGHQLESNSLTAKEYQQLLHWSTEQLEAEAHSVVNCDLELREVAQFKSMLHTTAPFSAVLDGLNAAHYNRKRGSPTQMLYIAQRLQNKMGGKILVVSRAHLLRQFKPPPTLASFSQHWGKKGIHFFFTGNRVADDCYVIHGCLASGPATYLVSNDQLGDHAYYSSQEAAPAIAQLLQQWQRGRQITMGEDLQIKFPVCFREIVQWTDRGWHLPLADSKNRWLCVTRRNDRVKNRHIGHLTHISY